MIINASNVIAFSVKQVKSEQYGNFNLPMLHLNVEINPGDVWRTNEGLAPTMLHGEFSIVADSFQGTKDYIISANERINFDGDLVVYREGNVIHAKLGVIDVYDSLSNNSGIYAGFYSPVTILYGTNGVYALMGGLWHGRVPQFFTLERCSPGRQGYCTFYSNFPPGADGPLGTNRGALTQAQLTTATNWVTEHTFDPSTDPYAPGGESDVGGGTGTFSDNSDPVDFPDIPTLSSASTNFITLFTPTLSQLRNLSSYMWSDLFSIETFKKLFANPMDAILGLSIVPVDVPVDSVKPVVVGNISTDINMNVASTQYVEVDCGSLTIREFWGSYLDYAPYTKCSVYLPYIGTHAIKTDDIMGKTIHIKYHVDILSGACAAYIKCGDSVLYQFIGQVSSSIPISAVDFTNVINGALNIVSSVGTLVATGGFSAPASIAKLGADAASDYTRGHKWSAGASMVQDVMGMKPEVERSGAISGTGGMLSAQKPYLIIERPRQALPKYQNDYTGYPAFVTRKLRQLSGYTEVENIHLENIPCTEKEADEIVSFLESGVIL